jgi:hypothetical protein
MLIFELFEQTAKKHASLSFGRMNPPTLGHAKLLDTTANAADGGDYFIFPSHTQDSKKNPLSFEDKVKFLKLLYPRHSNNIVDSGNVRTVMDALHYLYDQGYTDVTYVAGSDRLPAFKELLRKYNGVNTKSGFYKFDSINFVSSGSRDPDSDDRVEGISASMARKAAVEGDFETFKKAVGSNQRIAAQLYLATREAMGITEDAAGVGVVATNKKMARDPRYSHSMTVDVRPDTPQKNMKALRLA